MGRFVSLIVLVAICAPITGCRESGESEATFGKESFVGRWIPDAEKTLEEKKNSPSYEPGKDDTLSDTVKNAMEQLELEITDTQIIYLRGGRQQALPYAVQSANPTSQCLTVSAKMGDKEGEMTLRLIDGEYLNLKSAGSDSGNLFVWRRVSESQ